MGLFDEFKRLAHPYEDEEPDDDFDGFDDFDAPAPRAERRERPERLERSSRNVDTLYGSSQEEERRSNKVVNIRAATQLQVVLVKPEKFEDASAIADHLREKDVYKRQALEGGVPGQVEEAGCPLGTTMVVRDLFYNTPARLKFMKKDAAEGAAVFAVVQRAALSHPEVSVKFIRDGKQELLTPGDGQMCIRDSP